MLQLNSGEVQRGGVSKIKTLLWIGIVSALIFTAFLLPGTQDITMRVLLDQTRGEHWYRLEFSNQNIGQYFSSTLINLNQEAIFSSSLNFTLPGAQTTQINESLTFAAAAPHVLQSGTYTEISEHKIFREVTLTRIENGQTNTYELSISGDGKTQTRAQQFTYTLKDHLGLELWLKQEHPRPGRILQSRNFDFNQFKPAIITWHVVENNPDGYVVSNSSMIDDSIYTLDRNFLPQSFSLAGLFKLYRITPKQARLATRTNMVRSKNLHVPLAQSLGDPTLITALRLEIDSVSAVVLQNAESHKISESGGKFYLETRSNKAMLSSLGSGADSLAETLLFPIHHPHIKQLGDMLDLDPLPEMEKLGALVEFVNTYLDYQEHTRPLTLINALKTRSGDCTEYADLLTTLARHIGLPAESVTGLAYSNSPTPGFFVHAWNRVKVNDRWHTVDPTWNELQVDATHIAFPTDSIGQLKAYAAIPAMRFVLKKVERELKK